MSTNGKSLINRLSIFSKSSDKQKNSDYQDLIEYYAASGVDNLSFLDKSEQVIVISFYMKKLGKLSKTDLFLVGDDDSSDANAHLTMLVNGDISDKRFAEWAKRRLINGCIAHINDDLEKEYVKHAKLTANDSEDREYDRFDRARDLIAATR